MTVMLWGLLILAIGAIAWWAGRAGWTMLRDSYRTLPDDSKRNLSLPMTVAVLLTLRGMGLLVVAQDAAINQDAAIISVSAGWLLAAVVVMLILRWPRH
ncbi:MAG: hypothetical protein J7M15_02710 [Anaerolineae bacterium]|nr:hypothetical protein [Anaerolineae bacterium]